MKQLNTPAVARPYEFPVTVTKVKAAVPAPPSLTSKQRARHRLANAIAAELAANAERGQPHYGYETRLLRLSHVPALRRILRQAPGVAASGDRWAVATAHTPRGALTVVLLHGPDWSLVMPAARPLPAFIVAVHDAFSSEGEPCWTNLIEATWLPELIAMNLAVLDVLDPTVG